MSFLFLNANSPWVYGLAGALARRHSVHVVAFYEWLVYAQKQPTWPVIDGENIDRHTMPILPTGFAGPIEPVLRPFLSAAIQAWCSQLEGKTYVVVMEPFMAPWVRSIPRDQLIYYNIDDYLLYRPDRVASYQGLEDELIRRAHLTLCASRVQQSRFRGRHPDLRHRIHHFPHGVYPSFVNDNAAPDPRNGVVGYVGGLDDRIDWSFVRATVDQCPDLEFEFVGRLTSEPEQAAWVDIRSDVLARRNVEHVGYVAYEDLPDQYASFGAQWIPYDASNPFNVASSPTKIMDGIASGRPVVSTPIPECTLYPEWIHVVPSVDDAASALRSYRRNTRPDAVANQQRRFAQRQTWKERANNLISILLSK